MTGHDRNAHGCITSAGYTWSVLHQRCLRVFEDGLALEPEPAPLSGAVLNAFLVLDGMRPTRKAELFLPEEPGGPGGLLLERSGANGLTQFVHATRPIRLKVEGKRLVVEVDGQVRFARSLEPGRPLL